jgi:hypothetical protein
MWFIGRSCLTKWVSASRKPEGPGEFGPNPSGFGFVRWKDIGLAKSLDLVSNSLRQNGSIWTSFALTLGRGEGLVETGDDLNKAHADPGDGKGDHGERCRFIGPVSAKQLKEWAERRSI